MNIAKSNLKMYTGPGFLFKLASLLAERKQSTLDNAITGPREMTSEQLLQQFRTAW